MAYIEIKTAHNIVIAYEIATLPQRIFAYLIDIIIISAYCFTMLMICTISFYAEGKTETLYTVSICVTILPVFLFYTLVSENLMNGHTLGKMSMGLRILKLNGRTPDLQDYITRWTFRMIDIYSTMGTLACTLIGTSQRGQRLGDIFSNTVVVHINKNNMKLNQLLSIKTTLNYEATYLEAKKLGERNAVLIKNILDRYIKYPNLNNKALVEETQSRIIELLDITEVKHNAIDFLRIIIKDYTTLSR